MGYNENYIEPWCQYFVECHLPALIDQGSKVGTHSNVDKTCALGLLCTGFVIFMAKYTNSTLFDQQIRDAAEQRHHPGQYNKPDQCEEDAVRRFLFT